MSSGDELELRLGPGAVVRRRPGLLFRWTGRGYLLHPGDGIIRVTGVGAEVWAQLVDEMTLVELVDRRAAATGSNRSDVEAEVLAVMEQLQRCRALEVVPE